MKKQFLSVTSWRKVILFADAIRRSSGNIFGYDGNYSFAQLPVIKYFFENPGASPQVKDLAEISGLSSGAISQAIDLYVEDGILERGESTISRRSISVKLSAKGYALRQESLNKFKQLLQPIESALDHKTAANFHEALCILAQTRIGNEHTTAKRPCDLCRISGPDRPHFPGETNMFARPDWMLLLHFADAIRFPAMIFYYGGPGRMTIGKLRVLNYLFSIHGHKELPKIKNLAEQFHIASAAVTQTLNSLFANGMIQRVPGRVDRRVTFIGLSSQGEEFLKNCTASYAKFMKNALSCLSQEQLDAFIAGLDIAVDFIQHNKTAVPAPKKVSSAARSFSVSAHHAKPVKHSAFRTAIIQQVQR